MPLKSWQKKKLQVAMDVVKPALDALVLVRAHALAAAKDVVTHVRDCAKDALVVVRVLA